jgi:hypothetical protein
MNQPISFKDAFKFQAITVGTDINRQVVSFVAGYSLAGLMLNIRDGWGGVGRCCHRSIVLLYRWEAAIGGYLKAAAFKRLFVT